MKKTKPKYTTIDFLYANRTWQNQAKFQVRHLEATAKYLFSEWEFSSNCFCSTDDRKLFIRELNQHLEKYDSLNDNH